MFFTYLGKELRRRRRQAIVVSVGLALGIALVVTVSAMSSGVQEAQASVLHSLYGVGTDITVTQTATADQTPNGGFQVGPDGGTFQRDRLVQSPGQTSFKASEASAIARLDGVSDAAGGLNLTLIHLSGKLPTITTPATGSFGAAPASPQTQTPGQLDIKTTSVVGADVTNLAVGPISADQISNGRMFTSADAHADVAILDKAYAKQESLSVGASLTIGGEKFTIIGLATTTTSGAGANVYIPLAKAQSLADLTSKINTVYVKATNSSAISTAKRSIKLAEPKATVTTASDLAKQVSGSLSSASNLATDLGRWLSIAVLLAALVIASLLTLSSVGRRVRELGTLKALGWRTPRVVGQVMGESVVQGLAGGVLGIGLGFAGAWIVTRIMPSLTATVAATPGVVGFGPPGTAPGAGPQNPLAQTVSVALHTHVSMTLVGIAIGLSLVGGLIAGLTGGWRAARMRPADSMRQIA